MVETVEGFLDLDEAGLAAFIADRGLAMDLADLAFCQRYFCLLYTSLNARSGARMGYAARWDPSR